MLSVLHKLPVNQTSNPFKWTNVPYENLATSSGKQNPFMIPMGYFIVR